MPTPPKPFEVIATEGKSHRTKAELEQRQKEEQALLTGKKISARSEVRANLVAYKEFKRIVSLLKKIGKDDAIYTGVLNRYALMYSEELHYVERQAEFEKGLDELREEYGSDDTDMEPSQYYKLVATMQANINKLDYLASEKRKMMLAIEKECAMTVAAALRSIPKKQEKKEVKKNDDLFGAG